MGYFSIKSGLHPNKFMINNVLHQKRISLLAASLVAFFLILNGMRVPDLSRFHRPKPIHKAVIETEEKSSSYCVKKATEKGGETFALLNRPVDAPVPEAGHIEFPHIIPATGITPLCPHSSRAPPLLTA
jgi:hypothetical protein